MEPATVMMIFGAINTLIVVGGMFFSSGKSAAANIALAEDIKDIKETQARQAETIQKMAIVQAKNDHIDNELERLRKWKHDIDPFIRKIWDVHNESSRRQS